MEEYRWSRRGRGNSRGVWSLLFMLVSHVSTDSPYALLVAFIVMALPGYPLNRENRENGLKFPVKKNTGNLEILPKRLENTGHLVCSSSKFPDSKGKRYFKICCDNLLFFLSVSFVYVIVANHVNWHRENLPLDRENTGNLKMQFEWVPCITLKVFKQFTKLIAFNRRGYKRGFII